MGVILLFFVVGLVMAAEKPPLRVALIEPQAADVRRAEQLAEYRRNPPPPRSYPSPRRVAAYIVGWIVLVYVLTQVAA